ncbi:class F sortase [Streptomyces yaanensis]|uniref:Class F sortase n=1 Tax=Streptomyces yaanensis TaxID=1142239 RepID=A0ABV7SCQ2_9ACTN|nr:class F sortase [Streptomyces sp. CGMCC 4.7035]WNB96693.1 class F sortase [Streptomyces sp. CGMCC 4.7035]
MALPQSAPPEQSRSRPVSRTAGRALLWPAAAVGLGALLIHNSLTSPADPKPPTPPAAVAPPTTLTPPDAVTPPATVTPPAVAPRATVTPPGVVVPALPGPNATAVTTRGLPRSVPKRIEIPQIGVDAPFTALSLGASGQLNPPPANNTNLVGWFRGGASPGERGASIVVGHVDTKTAPAVFVLLRTLKPGSRVDITRADGIVARFEVDSVDTFSKAHFPDDRVYADTPTPELRVITCGGTYNHTVHDYESNVVVFAHLDSVKRPQRAPAGDH